MMKDIEKIIEEARKEAGSYSKEKVLVDLEEYVTMRLENDRLKSFLAAFIGDLEFGTYTDKLRCTGSAAEDAFRYLWPDLYKKAYEALKKEEEGDDGSVRGDTKIDE